jgi:F-type H+-transporting ATPase subunit g
MSLARVQQLLSKARAAAEPVAKMAQEQTVKQYDSLMARGQDYVVKDKAAADKLLKQWFFTNMAR